jgi:hypothetical protein
MYVPNNANVYLKAFAGFMAGITASATTDTTEADYSGYAQMADAWAQQLDTSWGVSAPTFLELDMIAEASEAVWAGRSPLPSDIALHPGSYTQVAEAVIARVLEGNAQVVSEGIDPNAGGGGGGGGNPAVVFDPNPPGTPTTNIRSNRSANQSHIAEPIVGATNLGSDTIGTTPGVTAPYAAALGGDRNTAAGQYSAIGGGSQNWASGEAAAIGGGAGNAASGDLSTVGGGAGNVCGFPPITFTIPAGGTLVTIGGDATNQFFNGTAVNIQPTTPAIKPSVASLTVASVPVFAAGNTTFSLSGPIDATTTGGAIVDPTFGLLATIGGGETNSAIATSTVSGGVSNTAKGFTSTIAGGETNLTVNGLTTVGGGLGNSATSTAATVAGGEGNSAIGQSSVISGGTGAQAFGDDSVIGGGNSNVASGFESTVGGGVANLCGNNPSTFHIVAGGTLVTIAGDVTTKFTVGDGVAIQPSAAGSGATTSLSVASVPAFGGVNTTFNLSGPIDTTTTVGTIVDTIMGAQSTVGGGAGNNAAGVNSTVGGGSSNIAVGQYATVGGGIDNLATGNLTTVGGGDENFAFGNDCTIGGGVGSSAVGFGATVGGGVSNNASGANSVVAGGTANSCGFGYSSFTIAAGGTLVTIVGNVTDRFVNTDSVGIQPNTPAVTRGVTTLSVADVPVFAAGNTTFNLSAPIDNLTTGGLIADTTFGTFAAVCGGNGNQATGAASFIGSGFDHVASGTGSVVSGGSNNVASGDTSSIPGGFLTAATRTGQHALCTSNSSGVIGDVQTSTMTLLGTTPGSGGGPETVILKFGQPAAVLFALDNQKNYMMSVEAVITADVTGSMKTVIVKFQAAMRCTGGVAHVAGTGQMGFAKDGDAALLATITSLSFAPTTNEANLTLVTTGVYACTAVAKLEFTEVTGTGA